MFSMYLTLIFTGYSVSQSPLSNPSDQRRRFDLPGAVPCLRLLCDVVLLQSGHVELTERYRQTTLLGQQALPAAQEGGEVHVVFEQHHHVIAVDDAEGRLFALGDRLDGLLAHAIDSKEDPAGVLRLAFNLLAEHVKIRCRTRILLPLGLKQIDLVVQLERSVDLLTH